MQQNHPVVVPNGGYGDAETLSWAFDGMPVDSWIAVTSQGCLDEYVLKRMFLNGLHELVRRKKPRGIIVYGKFPDEWRSRFPIPIIVFPSYSETRWEANNYGKR
jgi:hypothetical protein